MAQINNDKVTNLPYYQIPEYPEEYTPAAVAARMIDGLGFRYYWATEGLREEDLAFKPSADARTTRETVDHIFGLSKTILNAIKKVANERTGTTPPLTFEEKRRHTLENIKQASDLLKASKADEMVEFKIIFKNGDKTTAYPFWNLLNGPLADAIWHTGQIVSFRRSSGNPYNAKASLFSGKVRE